MSVNRSRRSRKSDVATGTTTTSTRSAPYARTRPENKTVSQLKDELDSKGIDYPRYSKKSQLIALWKRSENFHVHGPKQQKVPSFSISDDENDTEMPRILSETAEQGPRELRHSSQNASRFVTTTEAHDINKDGSLQTALLLSFTETVKTLR